MGAISRPRNLPRLNARHATEANIIFDNFYDVIYVIFLKIKAIVTL